MLEDLEISNSYLSLPLSACGRLLVDEVNSFMNILPAKVYPCDNFQPNT